MPTLLDEIRELKTRAKNRRDAERYEAAVSTLRKAIDLAESDMAKSEDGEWRRLMASELVDCYGLLGGVQRRWALESKSSAERDDHLLGSILAYDKGYKYESDPEFSLSNSYNMLNRLISRILYYKQFSPEPADPESRRVNIIGELEEVRKRIREQVTGPRRGDIWALADLALVELLLDQAEPSAAYAAFCALSPPDYAYLSVLAGLLPLSKLDLPVAGKLKGAIALLQQQLAKLN